MDDNDDNDDYRMPEHVYTISSPCETDGSGELKSSNKPEYVFLIFFIRILIFILYIAMK